MTPRRAFHAILAGDVCVSPASVYDPLSARAAEALGYPLAMLAGSAVANGYFPSTGGRARPSRPRAVG